MTETETDQHSYEPAGGDRFAQSVIRMTRGGQLPETSVARYAEMGRELIGQRLAHTASLFDAKHGENIKAGERADQLETALLQLGQVRLIWVARRASNTVRQRLASR